MKRILGIGLCAAFVLVMALPAVAASSGGISNWAAPRTWTPPAPAAQAGGRNALIATTYPPLPFIPVTPCRLVDTRAGSGFPAGYGPPSMAGGGTQRTFVFTGQCGIPVSARAVSMNIAVWAPPTRADLRVFPAGGATPAVSTLNWEGGILALANAAVVPIGTAGGIVVQIDGASTVDIFIDVNGFYGPTPQDQNQYFTLNTNSSGYTMYLQNLSTSCGGACGVYQSTGSGTALWGNSAKSGDGVYGTSGDASGAGVHGYLSSDVSYSAAVRGEHGNTGSGGIGVYGSHAGGGWGVYGTSASGFGVYGNSSSLYGVYGLSSTSFAILGSTASTASDKAGVLGHDGSTLPVISNLTSSAGLRGESGNNGVVGVAGPTGRGVAGIQVNASGGLLQWGVLGVTGYGVYAYGNMGASGTKPFVEPHPTDADKVIRYVAMEGPEAGTYFRAKATVVNGIAEIDVPETFRIVSDEEGLTVHVTPVGRAQAWIESSDLNRIVIGATKDVTVNVIVYGVRRAYKDWQVVAENTEYVPASPAATLPAALSAEAKKRLINNGTYNQDGTVNMRTAERVGWAQQWRQEAEAQAKVDEARAKANEAAMATQMVVTSRQ